MQPAKSLRLEEKPQPRTKSDENDGSLSGLESSNPKTTSENSEAASESGDACSQYPTQDLDPFGSGTDLNAWGLRDLGVVG